LTKYSINSNLAVQELQGNKIGTVTGNCKTISVDPTKKDYFSKITLEYDSANVEEI